MQKSGRRKMVALLWALLLGCCFAYGSSTSSKEAIAFDSSLINRTVETAAADGSHSVPDDVTAAATQAATAGFDSGGLSAYLPGSTFSAMVNSPKSDEDDVFLLDNPKFGMKKFLLAVFLLGGLIRYLTSESYRRFICEVLDPLEW